MKCILLAIFILLNFTIYSQDTLDIDSLLINSGNNISGLYNYNNNSPIFNIAYSGENGVSNKYVIFNTNTVYSLQYNVKIISNEWQQKTNVNWKDIFLLHVFNHSLVRHIDTDNSIGLGTGKWWEIGSISYAMIFQNTNYTSNVNTNTFRHSFRVKLKYNRKSIGVNCEYYYQPNLHSLKDNIIYGNIKLNLFNNRKINLTITDIVNYRSLSSIKLIHNLTLGVNFNFKR